MGFSVGIASFIVLIGFVAIFSAVSTAFVMNLQELTLVANDYLSNQKNKIDTQMQLTIDSVSATTCSVTIKNVGGKTIFLQNADGYNWNTIILSYGDNDQWNSYTIETYTISEVKVTTTNATLNPATHKYITPGEQVTITVDVPSGAPAIVSENIVSVTFASHYGVTASGEVTMG
jgi:archaellum component FlaF (FlaF/FlaG flagellin family)